MTALAAGDDSPAGAAVAHAGELDPRIGEWEAAIAAAVGRDGS